MVYYKSNYKIYLFELKSKCLRPICVPNSQHVGKRHAATVAAVCLGSVSIIQGFWQITHSTLSSGPEPKCCGFWYETTRLRAVLLAKRPDTIRRKFISVGLDTIFIGSGHQSSYKYPIPCVPASCQPAYDAHNEMRYAATVRFRVNSSDTRRRLVAQYRKTHLFPPPIRHREWNRKCFVDQHRKSANSCALIKFVHTTTTTMCCSHPLSALSRHHRQHLVWHTQYIPFRRRTH